MTIRKIDIRHFVLLLTADCADVTGFEVAWLYRRARYAFSRSTPNFPAQDVSAKDFAYPSQTPSAKAGKRDR